MSPLFVIITSLLTLSALATLLTMTFRRARRRPVVTGIWQRTAAVVCSVFGLGLIVAALLSLTNDGRIEPVDVPTMASVRSLPAPAAGDAGSRHLVRLMLVETTTGSTRVLRYLEREVTWPPASPLVIADQFRAGSLDTWVSVALKSLPTAPTLVHGKYDGYLFQGQSSSSVSGSATVNERGGILVNGNGHQPRWRLRPLPPATLSWVITGESVASGDPLRQAPIAQVLAPSIAVSEARAATHGELRSSASAHDMGGAVAFLAYAGFAGAALLAGSLLLGLLASPRPLIAPLALAGGMLLAAASDRIVSGQYLARAAATNDPQQRAAAVEEARMTFFWKETVERGVEELRKQ